MKEYSNEVANLIQKFCEVDNWHLSFDAERGMFTGGVNPGGKINNIRYLVEVRMDGYIVYGVSPLNAERDNETMMATMADFICRANHGLVYGNFELDMNDGEIRYKCSEICRDGLPSLETVKQSFTLPALMFKKYESGILGIMLANLTAKEAIALCEG